MITLEVKFESKEALDLFKKWTLGFGAGKFAYETRQNPNAPNNVDFEGNTILFTRQGEGNLAEPRYPFDESPKYFGSESVRVVLPNSPIEIVSNPSANFDGSVNEPRLFNAENVNKTLDFLSYGDTEEAKANVTAVNTKLSPDLEEIVPLIDRTEVVGTEEDNQNPVHELTDLVTEENYHGRETSTEFNTFGGAN